MSEHIPAVFFDWLDHLSKCQRCRIRTMTQQMLLELIEAAYTEGGSVAAPLSVAQPKAS